MTPTTPHGRRRPAGPDEDMTMKASDYTDASERRPIPGHTGYAVDAEGRVWSCWGRSRQGLLTTWRRKVTCVRKAPKNRPGNRYEVVRVRSPHGARRDLTRYVHRLVLLAFVGPCPAGLECCHEDGDKTNNRLSNLRWDTKKANAGDKRRHGVCLAASKLSDDDVREIRHLAAAGEKSIVIASRFKLNRNYVNRLIARTARGGVDLIKETAP